MFELFINIIPFILLGIIFKKYDTNKLQFIIIKLFFPLHIAGLLVKEGIDNDLIISALISFFSISIIFILIKFINIFASSELILILYSLIGNTSFIGIPVALALLPSSTINFTVGFDLGSTLFFHMFSQFLINKNFNSLIFNPVTKGIIIVLLAYLFGLEKIFGDNLLIPARISICLILIMTGMQLGNNITNSIYIFSKKDLFLIIFKLIIFPFVIFLICKIMRYNKNETKAMVLQSAMPISFALLVYKKDNSPLIFISYIISLITIPIIAKIMKLL